MQKMSLEYAYEKFYLAVIGMAQSKKKMRERLEEAYVYHIIHVREEDIPSELLQEFCILKKMISSRPPRGTWEGSIRATTQQMSPRELSEAARLTVHLFAAQHEKDYQAARKEGTK
jgi:hypothetical protein